MDNLNQLSELLAPLLSDPQTMAGLRQAAEQMGLGGLMDESCPEEKPSGQEHTREENRQGLPADILSAVTKLAPLLSAQREDETTRLLNALRPFLSSSRAKRLDEAERLLSVTRVLSILKESKLM